MKFVGFRAVNFTATDGALINGYNLFFLSPINKGGDGYCVTKTSKLFVSEKKFIEIFDTPSAASGMLNENCELLFNQYGKVVSVDFK